jgi:hypothetical protein
MRVPALKNPFMGRTQPAVAVERAQRELGNKNRVSVIYFFLVGRGRLRLPFSIWLLSAASRAAHWRGHSLEGLVAKHQHQHQHQCYTNTGGAKSQASRSRPRPRQAPSNQQPATAKAKAQMKWDPICASGHQKFAETQ